LKKGVHIGSARSQVRRKDERSYDFWAAYTFEQFNVGMLHVSKMEHVYRVSEDGKLQAISVKSWFHLGNDRPAFGVNDMMAEVQGEVEGNTLEPRLLYNGVEQKLFSFGKIDMNEQGSVVNPMLPVNRLRGLRDGRTWKITMFDPFRGMTGGLMKALVKQSATVPTLIAEVSSDTLFWDKKLVACHKIEYYEPGKEVTARTWARKLDGMVLQQEASRDSFDLVLKRVPN
jgi:hypothetical protein